MRYALLGLSLLLGLTSFPASAQVLYTTVGVDAEAGTQSNPYLDPLLGEWDPTADPWFGAITPIGMLTWEGRRGRLQAFAQTRIYPGRTDVAFPPFVQTGVAGFRRLSPTVRLGVSGGVQRYQLNASRDTGWLIPSVRWSPLSFTTVTAAAGVSRRRVRTFDPVQRQTSLIATLTVESWLMDRLRGSVRLYVSDGRAATSSARYGGSGVTIGVHYVATPALSFTLEGTGERLQTEGSAQAGQAQTVDLIGRTHAAVNWHATRALTAFFEGQALYGDVSRSSVQAGRIAAGVRYRWTATLHESTPATKPVQYCVPADSGVRFRIRYDGDRRPFITGEFNGWNLPGIQLHETEPGSELFTVTLPLPSGRYEYRIHLVSPDDGPSLGNSADRDSSPEWMRLPSTVPVTEDSFGGTNGVCVIP